MKGKQREYWRMGNRGIENTGERKGNRAVENTGERKGKRENTGE